MTPKTNTNTVNVEILEWLKGQEEKIGAYLDSTTGKWMVPVKEDTKLINPADLGLPTETTPFGLANKEK